MKKIILFFAATFFCFNHVFSQSGEVVKISLAANQGQGGVLNLYNKGLAIKTNNSSECEFMFYDTDLEKNGSTKFELEGRREYVENYYFDTILNKIVVFHNAKRAHHITLISADGKKKKTLDLELRKKTYLITNLITVGSTSYILSYQKRKATINIIKKTTINIINLASGEIIPLELPTAWKARDIKKVIRVNSKYLAVFYIDQTVRNKKFNNIALLDEEGNVVVDKLVTNDEDDFPISELSITDLGNDELALAGTYSSSIKSGASSGMFVAKIVNLKLTYIKYFDYNNIKNFYDFLSEKKKEKAEKKAERSAKRGKSMHYLAITHPVIMINENLIVTAEFYYPTYRTETTTTYVNGRAQITTRTVFDGYQYTHTIILGINENGKKEFEYCIPFHLSHKPYVATQKLKRRISDDEIKYSYIGFNQIFSFSITNDKFKEYDKKTLVTVDEDKKLKAVSSSIDSWYDNYFYSLTSYTTKEKGRLIGGKETNYFLLKLSVD